MILNALAQLNLNPGNGQIAIIVLLISAVVLGYATYCVWVTRMSEERKLLWTLVIWLLPFVALVLWLVIRSRVPERQQAAPHAPLGEAGEY